MTVQYRVVGVAKIVVVVGGYMHGFMGGAGKRDKACQVYSASNHKLALR
jgi:hypothetical protein